MREAIASYAMRAAEKMRRYKVAAENIFVFMHTNTFNNDPFYSNGASARFVETTNDTGEVVALAVRLGERFWKDGFCYSKYGVMITELLPEAVRQPALWGDLDRERRDQVWRTMDKLNASLGRAIPFAFLVQVQRMPLKNSERSIDPLDGPHGGRNCRR